MNVGPDLSVWSAKCVQLSPGLGADEKYTKGTWYYTKPFMSNPNTYLNSGLSPEGLSCKDVLMNGVLE